MRRSLCTGDSLSVKPGDFDLDRDRDLDFDLGLVPLEGVCSRERYGLAPSIENE
jgi:hypothetical protein